MSLRGKKWLVKNSDTEKELFQKLMENRGVGEGFEIENFHDPFLFLEMKRAVGRIEEAIKKKERVMIFGDYDVDGISGTAILMHTLKEIGAEVSCRVPNRLDDGYGLSERFIKEFEEKKVRLIITVDCGISGKSPISFAKEKGIETIITDHHTIPGDFPSDAFAIIHPKLADSGYPFEDLTGAGVALKLAHALIQTKIDPAKREDFLESLLDLASLGTVADLGPLLNENRLIVKRGLKVLSNTRWTGLRRIKELANIKDGDLVDTHNIGYHLAPRINAAGRIGDPYIPLMLLLQKELTPQTQSLGDSLETLNKERQKMTETALDEVEGVLYSPEDQFILMAQNPNWHVGVLGLIAGKLAEKHGRPAIIMQDFGDMLTGSARSPQYFNIIEAITHCKEYLSGFGGHAQAAGFNIKKENLEAFKEKISEYAKKTLRGKELKSVLEIDCEIGEAEISFETIKKIQELAPFGIGNQKPAFLLKNVEPLFVQQVGKTADHIKFQINAGGNKYEVIAFGMGGLADKIRVLRKIDMVFHLEINRWNNRENLQLQALDFGACQQ